MSISNVLYPSTIIFKEIISNIFERTFDIFPLSYTNYPFAFFQIEILQNCPGNKLQLRVDTWGNNLTKNELLMKTDNLVKLLDFSSKAERGIHLSGSVENVKDIPVQEENVCRYQIIAIFDVYNNN